MIWQGRLSQGLYRDLRVRILKCAAKALVTDSNQYFSQIVESRLHVHLAMLSFVNISPYTIVTCTFEELS